MKLLYLLTFLLLIGCGDSDPTDNNPEAFDAFTILEEKHKIMVNLANDLNKNNPEAFDAFTILNVIYFENDVLTYVFTIDIENTDGYYSGECNDTFLYFIKVEFAVNLFCQRRNYFKAK